jgi:hypothetical protein
MLIRLTLVACLLAPAALAQAPPPDTAALGAEIMDCVGGKVQLRGRINQLEAELAKLKADAAKQPETPK